MGDRTGHILPPGKAPVDVKMSGDWPTFTCGCGKHTLGGKNAGFLKFPLDPTQVTDDYSRPDLYFWCPECGSYYEVKVTIMQVDIVERAQALADAGHPLATEAEILRPKFGGEAKDEHEGTDEEV
jgi:hypothetical protein